MFNTDFQLFRFALNKLLRYLYFCHRGEERDTEIWRFGDLLLYNLIYILMRKITKKLVNEISYKIIGAAIEVHRVLGPGLLESSYEKALLHELKLRGLKTSSQRKIQIPYKRSNSE